MRCSVTDARPASGPDWQAGRVSDQGGAELRALTLPPRPERLHCHRTIRCPRVSAMKRKSRQANSPNGWFTRIRAFVAADAAERGPLPDLDMADILAWADSCHARTGSWPHP